MPTKRMYPRGRPHRWQRLCTRTPNLGGFFHFSIMHFLANEKILFDSGRKESRILDTRKWHAKKFKQAAGFFIVTRSGDDIHL
jgi:type II secretory pathway component PulF